MSIPDVGVSGQRRALVEKDKQYTNKQAVQNKILVLLGLEPTRKNRILLNGVADNFGRLSGYRGSKNYHELLTELQQKGLTKWSQLSPYLSGDPDWKNR